MTVEPRDALLAVGQCSVHHSPGQLRSGGDQTTMWWVLGTRRSAPTEAKGTFTEEPRPSSEKPSGSPVTGTSQNSGSVGAAVLLRG